MKVKIFTGRNPQKVEEEINKFSEEHDGKCPMTTCLDGDDYIVYTGFYWYDAPGQPEKPKEADVVVNGPAIINMTKWKHDVPGNYWTKNRGDGIEFRAGLSDKTGKWFFSKIEKGIKTWYDVVGMNTNSHTIQIKPRQ